MQELRVMSVPSASVLKEDRGQLQIGVLVLDPGLQQQYSFSSNNGSTICLVPSFYNMVLESFQLSRQFLK